MTTTDHIKPVRLAGQAGFALITALVFLVILSLVAVVAIRGTSLEVKMSANSGQRTTALQSSELVRSLISGGPTNGSPYPGGLLDAHVYNRGWPVTGANGDIPDALFNYPLPTGFKLRDSCAANTTCTYATSTPDNWFNTNTEPNFPGLYQMTKNNPATSATASALLADATYDRGNGGLVPYADVSGKIATYKLYTTLDPGSGAAMVAGYEGQGRGLGSSGADIFFYLLARGQDFSTNPQSTYDTSAVYRYIIRN